MASTRIKVYISPSHNEKVYGDDEEKKTGDYLLIPGGEKLFKDRKCSSVVNEKHKHSQSYHCRGEREHERQGQSETFTE